MGFIRGTLGTGALALIVALGGCGDSTDSRPVFGFDAARTGDGGAIGPDADVDAGGGFGTIVSERSSTAVGCCGHQVGLALGPSGEARMIGITDRGRYLWFGSRDGGEWSDEEIATNPGHDKTAFAVGSDDTPHVLYAAFGASSLELQYARRDGGVWSTQRVGDMGEVAGDFAHFDIAVDASDNPHVVFLDSSTRSLMYAVWTGASFDLSTIEAPSGADDQSGEFARLAFAPDGSVHVSYLAVVGDASVLRHAEGPGAWAISDVPGTGNGVHGSLMVDSAGNPHIVSADLRDRRARGMYYSRREGGAWTELEVHPDLSVVAMDAAIDSMGRPHVFVSENRAFGYGPWIYYRFDGTEFQVFERPPPEVPPGGFSPGPSPFPESVAIAIDAMDEPHFAIPNFYLHF